MDVYSQAWQEHTRAFESVRSQQATIERMAEVVSQCILAGGKVLLAGNGGSAADAQHIAGELVGRFRIDRPAMAAVALSCDTSVGTSVANDYGFETVFARQIEALGNRGDVVWLLSTSGTSPNIVQAAEMARRRGCTLIASSGRDGGQLAKMAKCALIVDGDRSDRIQEGHQLAYHLVCELVEARVVGAGTNSTRDRQ